VIFNILTELKKNINFIVVPRDQILLLGSGAYMVTLDRILVYGVPTATL